MILIAAADALGRRAAWIFSRVGFPARRPCPFRGPSCAPVPDSRARRDAAREARARNTARGLEEPIAQGDRSPDFRGRRHGGVRSSGLFMLMFGEPSEQSFAPGVGGSVSAVE